MTLSPTSLPPEPLMPEQTDALAELDTLVRIRSEVARKLRDQAKALRKKERDNEASEHALWATRMNQQNLRILHVQRKLRMQTDVSAALAALKTITADATKLERALQSGADLLSTAATLVQIITRISNVFSA